MKRICLFFFIKKRKQNFDLIENGNSIDPQYNAVLRSVLEECRRNNMPKETIDRSIKRAVCFSLNDFTNKQSYIHELDYTKR